MIPPCRECQFIEGEPKGERTVFCGRPVAVLGKSWCWEHLVRVYNRGFVPIAQITKELNRDGDD
jgi:hypothetical protein